MPNLMPPQTFFIDRVESRAGTMLLIHDPEERLRALDFHDFETRMRQLLRLHYGKDGGDFVLNSRETPAAIRRALAGYFAGDLTAINAIPVATAGTSFQREVWAALRGIRPGTTLGYGAKARTPERRSRRRPCQRCQPDCHRGSLPPRHRRGCKPCLVWRRRRPQTVATRS
jgi:O6-methylguanine-DNA--protein-cysteine methyltransferase